MKENRKREKLVNNVREKVLEFNKNSRFYECRKFRQHGDTSVYEHSISVAIKSIDIALRFNLNVDWNSLITGALLHDYFLYDYHEKTVPRRKHGVSHAKTALRNALEDFSLNDIEQNIIKRHMFPVNPVPPKYIESWVVTVADKIAAVEETLKTKAVTRRIADFGIIEQLSC